MKKYDLSTQPNIGAYLTRLPQNLEFIDIDKATLSEVDEYGYTKTLIKVTFKPSGKVDVYSYSDEHPKEDYLPTDAETKAMESELKGFQWPIEGHFNLADPSRLPKEWREAQEADRWAFCNPAGDVVMLQVYTGKDKKGQKQYLPIVIWNGEFEHRHPVGPRPIWGLESLCHHSTVIISEGAKAASFGAAIAAGKVPDHPWRQELSEAAHIGILGAHAVRDSDLSALKRAGITRAIIIADNDTPGREAVPQIAKELDCEVFAIQFDDRFPVAFDIGDKFPDDMFRKETGAYVGPSYFDLIRPATFATKELTDEKGKKFYVARDVWLNQWKYSRDDMLYLNKHIPARTYTSERLNKAVKPFQHSGKTQISAFIDSSYGSCVDLFDYRPDKDMKFFREDGLDKFNTFQPTLIKAAQGDTEIFHDFLAFAVADPEERRQLLRWIYTLVGRPDLRMAYGVLINSAETGTGKTSLGLILQSLVGTHNCSNPTTEEIDGPFNGWIANRRLAIINEAYIGGGNFKASNKMKSIATDKFIRVNEKFLIPKDIRNFIHILACSNAVNALSLDAKDRRWFVPRWTEERWDRFEELYDWMNNGGLAALLFKARTFSDYVQPHEKAPRTERRRQVIESEYSKILQNILALDRAVSGDDDDKTPPEKICFSTDAMQELVEQGHHGPVYRDNGERANIERFKELGWLYTGQHETGAGTLNGYQPKFGKKRMSLLVSPALKDEMLEVGTKEEWLALAKEYCIGLADLQNDYGKSF